MGFIRNRRELAVDRRGAIIVEALEAGLEAASPRRAVGRLLRCQSGCLVVAGRRYCPPPPVYVAGFGKASRGMAEAVLEVLDGRVEAGMVIAPRGMGGRVGPVDVLEGDHPVPGEATLRSSRRLLEFLGEVPENGLLLVLVSGGGSSLFEVPADNLSLEEVAETTRLLMEAGADIYELNAVRKHLSAVKGGQLLRYTRTASVETIVISDVVGDRLDTIASGPTVPDPTTFRDAWSALARRGLLGKVPRRVREWLERGLRGEAPETPKPGDPLFERSHASIAARNADALAAITGVLEDHSVTAIVLTDTLRGEARETGRVLASLLEAALRDVSVVSRPPVAIVAGGETTVTVHGNGRGGRNQELCLSLAAELHRLKLLDRYKAACMGTDGVDGNSPAAGAVVDETTIPRALGMGVDPYRFLEDNDSYGFFSRVGGAIDTGGYTGTNVNDVFVGLIGADELYR